MENMHKVKSLVEKERIIMFGYLEKRSKYLKIWKVRFVVLTNKNLYSFTSCLDIAACTMNISLKNCISVSVTDEKLNRKFTFAVKEKNFDYYFQASNEMKRLEWIEAIEYQIGIRS